MIVRRTIISICTAALVVVCPCKDKEPSASHYRDLGDDASGTILVPVSSQWHNADIAKGRADWVPFRKPADLEEEVEDKTAEGDPEEIKKEILEFIADYDELLADGDVDELLEYHVESQQASYRPFAELGIDILQKLDRLAVVLKEKLPEEGKRVDSFVSTIKYAATMRAVAPTLEVVSESEVIANVPAGSLLTKVNFKRIDDEWFVEFPTLPDISTIKPVRDMQIAGFDTLIQGLDSGTVLPKNVLQQMEAMAKMVPGAQKADGGAAVETDDGANENADDEGD